MIHQVLAHGRVVKLENDIGSGFDQFRGPVYSIVLSELPGDVAAFDAVIRPQRRLRNPATVHSGRFGGRHAVLVTWTSIPHRFVVFDVGGVSAEHHANVMRNGGLAGADLHRGDPGVLFKTAG